METFDLDFSDITEASKKKYCSQLTNLHHKVSKGKPFTSLEFLKNHGQIIKTLDSDCWGKKNNTILADGSKKTYLNAIIAVMRRANLNYPALNKYETLRDLKQTEYDVMLDTHKKSERQQERWITLKEFDNMIEKIERKISYMKLWKHHYDCEAMKDHKVQYSQNIKDFQNLQTYVMLMLHRHQPPVRNDYKRIICIKQREHKQLSCDDMDGNNYFIICSKNKSFFNFNNYKTAKVYGTKNVALVPELHSLMKKWLKINTTGFLLVDSNFNALSTDQLSKRMGNIFMEYTGKRLGSTLLRNIYLSEKYQEFLKQSEEDADKMMHSVEMQKNYVKYDED